MIRYYFICENQHDFDAWFKDINVYENEIGKTNSLYCPICGSNKITKKITAPALVNKRGARKKEKTVEQKKLFTDIEKINQTLDTIHKYVKDNFLYVGEEFKEMALKMHKGTLDRENIYGEATQEDILELNEEGVDVLPIGVKIDTKKIN